MTKDTPLSRRKALARLGGLAATAYVAPALTTMSQAFAQSASYPSKPSKASKASKGSAPTPASPPTRPSAPSPASAPSFPSGVDAQTGCDMLGGVYDPAANTCTIRRG